MSSDADDHQSATDPVPAHDHRADHPHTHTEDVEQALNEFVGAARKATEAVNKRAGRDVFIATGVGLGLLAIVGASMIWFHWGFVVFVLAMVVGAQIEMSHAFASQRGVRIVLVPLMIGSVSFLVGAYLTQAYRGVTSPMILMWIIGLTIVLIFIVRILGPMEGFVNDVVYTVFLLVYPCLLVSGMLFILTGPQGPLLVAMLILGIAGSDTGGYVLGMLIGKHPFAPRISPKKSWEGVAGSFILSGVFLVLMTIFAVGAPWWKGLVLTAVLVSASIVGDLVESVIKRDLGLKDMGHFFPGHGGIMDRIDSYIVAASPVWVTVILLFWRG
ncbi:MAG: phosphatidate cytidylyltransferase [Propionibacteriaceae bacterium]|nr:phosphatidate cytidylyltransferase [Propionibacteriaceae bacterium]